MANNVDLKSKVIEFLQSLPVCKPNGSRTQWVVRCPYCGDSKKNLSHGHFSIKVDINNDTAMVYRCFKCPCKGLLLPQTLEDLGIYNKDLISDLVSFNKKVSKRSRFHVAAKNFYVPLFKSSYINNLKLDYINNRIGGNITYQDCIDYKIILNLSEFIKANDIEIGNGYDDKFYIKPSVLREIDRAYVGFLSSNNNKIIFRDITNKSYLGRYYNITIDIINNSPNNFYSLVSKFSLLYTDPIHIHIAEGTFDILSIYTNIFNKDSQNALFFAVGGYSYSSILKYLIYVGVSTDIILHIYSDNDKTNKDHMSILRHPIFKIWVDRIFIHRNVYMNEKDFGVPKLRMKEICYEIRNM